MTKQDLIKLRDKVAAGNRGDGLNTVSVFGDNNGPAMLAAEAFDGSVDAAIELLEAVLPDWDWVVRSCDKEEPDSFFAHVWTGDIPGFSEDRNEYWAETPARALLLATLEALIARAE